MSHRSAPLFASLCAALASFASAQDRIHATAIRAFEGASIAALGDVDGDGFPDLAVHHEMGTAVRVISGFSAKPLFDLPDFGNNLTTGIPLANAGDLDGDGRDDIAVGYLVSLANTAAVFSGKDGALLRAFPIPPELVNHPASFGFAVAGPGDVDGDGVPDVAVGAPGVDVVFGGQSFSASGRVYVLSGANGARLLAIDSPVPSIEFGAALDRIGDVDADGVPDVLVGGRGRAFLFSGRTGALLAPFTSGTPNDEFGLAVAGAGDLDGDGIPDVLVGAPDETLSGPGAVYAFSSVTHERLWRVLGSAPGAALGRSVRPLADANGDGVDDVIAGAPGPFFPPTANGRALGLSGVDGAELFAVASGPNDLRFGFFVEGLGDVNGDGVSDFAATSVGEEPQQARLDLYSSHDLALITNPDAVSVSAGGTQTLRLSAGPAAAGGLYFVLGTASGIRPGFDFLGHHVPLNPDPYFSLMAASSGGLIAGALGTLDSEGNATATFTLPPLNLPPLVGLAFAHAAIVWSAPTGGPVRTVSNATTILFAQ